MLIDFETLHRTYLIGRPENGTWRFTPTNEREPRKGIFPSSHQVFSNHALQIALSIYNSVDSAGNCVGVSHCLYLQFSRKAQGRYLLANDPDRIAFHLDIGVAGELYGLAVGHCENATYRAVRSGKAPKTIAGVATYREGRRLVVLRASSTKEGQPVSVEVELDHAAAIALAAHCLGYGRLLYPSFSDSAVQSLLWSPAQYSRACAEKSNAEHREAPALSPLEQGAGQDPEPTEQSSPPTKSFGPEVVRLHKVIWAIGNQKWPGMKLPVLQAMQRLDDTAYLKRLIDSGNAGDFREWDAFLS